jgi:NAD+ diphosphatase
VTRDILYFAFRGRDLLVLSDGAAARVPDGAAWASLGLAGLRENELAAAAIAVELAEDAEPPAGMAFENLRRLHGRLDDAALGLAVRAVQIVEWDRGNQFCPRCAAPVERVAGEFAKRCASCRSSAYPRLSPAVIVLVERDDTCLLGRNARFPLPMYSTLAGFVEPGETLEETVHREIREEAGIEVRDLCYFGSQPWPFPDSLMIAFTAVHAGGELRADPAELSDVRWFEVGEIPMVPPRISIARRLIDAWVRRQGGDPDALKSPA